MVPARPRERILTTAIALFSAEGIGAVGVNRIIGQADVAPMTLYRQFGNKDTLVAATIEQWSTSWLHRLADAMDRRGDDPGDRFDGLWDELEAWFAEDGFRGSFVANAATELRSEPDHPAQSRIVQHRQALRQLLQAGLVEHRDERAVDQPVIEASGCYQRGNEQSASSPRPHRRSNRVRPSRRARRRSRCGSA